MLVESGLYLGRAITFREKKINGTYNFSSDQHNCTPEGHSTDSHMENGGMLMDGCYKNKLILYIY